LPKGYRLNGQAERPPSSTPKTCPDSGAPTGDPTTNEAANQQDADSDQTTEVDAWEAPVPLDADQNRPAFPLDALPDTLALWAKAEAEATQTPPDLAALLALDFAAAGLARKFRACPRPGWGEPLNLFIVAVLLPGERKSAVFEHAIAPILQVEVDALKDAAPKIAEEQSKHRQLQKRLETVENKIAKITLSQNLQDLQDLQDEARKLAHELANHHVPHPPQFVCDDCTPEKLSQLLHEQGGRMLQASPEGTAFEIAKGRYSETANFDVYLKGHAGDSLRVGRVTRTAEIVDQPALSVALAVQPDVITGLAEQATMRGRGFLARWLYGLPISMTGRRKVAAAPVPSEVSAAYASLIKKLWATTGAVDEQGKPAPHWLRFDQWADRALQKFERWLEPQLAEGEPLSYLAGWANKLAGAVVRLAAVFSVVERLEAGQAPEGTVGEPHVRAAIRLARDYFLPHAQAAFGLMGADPMIGKAKRILEWIRRKKYKEFKRHHVYGDVKNRAEFPRIDALDKPLELLVRHGYLREKKPTGREGQGRPAAPTFVPWPGLTHPVNPVNPVKGQDGGREPGSDDDLQDLQDLQDGSPTSAQ
jgi:hypothetical protein